MTLTLRTTNNNKGAFVHSTQRFFPRFLGLICSLAWIASLLSAVVHAQPSGREVAQLVYDRYVGEDAVSRQIMELVPADGQKRVRELTITAADRNGSRRTLLRFTSPADIQGTGFLAVEDGQGGTEQFLYLPALKRTRRIMTGQKSRSFVNTDFTYEDMERRPVDDSEHAIAGEETLNNVPCWILESRPKPGTESQYSLVRAWVAQDMPVTLRADFFAGGQEPVKRFTVRELENIQDIWTETKVVMEDLQSGHATVLATSEIKYNTGVQDSVFMQQALEHW
ncbi:MAG: outer membrane lipoprotein-sorting protein [Desulfovibrionales bacterium]|nr:outer membrane lipoprotein-sorting protein [Desulfovibrionales bacterium]